MEFRKRGYVFQMDEAGRFEIRNASGDLRFLSSEGVPFLPLGNRVALWSKPVVTTERSGDVDAVTFQMETNSLYENPRVVLKLRDDYIEMYFEGTVRRRFALHKWYLFEQGTDLNAIECLDFRSHINSPSAYKVHQTILGRRKLGTHGLDANTEDGDLMFAPHPMLFVFRNLEDSMVIAPMELVSAESLHVKMLKGTTIIDEFHIQVGDSLYWLEKGERLESPHFMITLVRDKDPFEALASATGLLVRDGHCRPKSDDDMEDWWFSPMWCSWGDQHTVLDSEIVISTAYTAEERAKAVDRITDELLDRVVGVIEKHALPVRTLILDDRWYTKQGDMKADTTKFPDMRGTVDRLHGKGFKVMAWASLYQFEKDSEVYLNHPEWFVVHHYPRNWHNPERNIVVLDYADPEVAQTFLGELMTRLLGDGKGGYNFDGIKFDWPFLLPHDYAFEDRDWVGKEKTIYNTQKLVYQAAKAVKQDALIIGVSPHPFFNDTQDIIRTYDVSTYDPRIHLDRARYVRAISPGMVPAMDEHVFYQNFFRYLDEGSRLGIPMLYNLIRFNGDGHLYTEDDYRRLKVLLDGYVERTPRLKRYLSTLR